MEVVQGKPEWAAQMSLWALFSPLFVMQGCALTSALMRLLEHLLVAYGSPAGARLAAISEDHDPCVFLTRGLRSEAGGGGLGRV